jgi:hypothetical protein
MKTVRHGTRYRHAQQRLRQGLSAKASAGSRRRSSARQDPHPLARQDLRQDDWPQRPRPDQLLRRWSTTSYVRRIHPVGTDRVLGSAYLYGLGLIERSDDDRRLAEKVHRLVVWHCEEHDRGDVVGHLGLHRFGYARQGRRCRGRTPPERPDTDRRRRKGLQTRRRKRLRPAPRLPQEQANEGCDARSCRRVPTHAIPKPRGQKPQFGVDGFEVAHSGQLARRVGVANSPHPHASGGFISHQLAVLDRPGVGGYVLRCCRGWGAPRPTIARPGRAASILRSVSQGRWGRHRRSPW